jgi:ABC-type multidrug transport system ATPase subunit
MPANPPLNSSNPSTKQKQDTPITIAVEGLGKKFNREWIFRDMNYTFQGGQTHAITGPNGSGKSTLLQILWGQMPPSLGTVRYTRASGEVNADDIYKNIAIAAPYLDIIDEFTLLEQLKFHFKLKTPRNGMTYMEMLEIMNMKQAQDKYISNFSSGMRQRVKLALAFFSNADIFFLDEPGTNLDNQSFNWYQEQLRNLPSHALIFIASNQASEYPTDARKLDIIRFR